MDDYTKSVLTSIDDSLKKIAVGLDRLVLAITGSFAMPPEDVSKFGRMAMNGQPPDTTRLTMVHEEKQYVRESIGEGRWLRYAIDREGNVVNPEIEHPDGERVAFVIG